MKHIILFVITCIFASSSLAQESNNPITSTCWFTASQDTTGYEDETLTKQHPAMPTMKAGWSFQATNLSGRSALLAVDHAMGFWVNTTTGVFSGDCSDIGEYDANTASTLANTRLWSQPDVETGSVILSIPQGTTVTITGGTANGRISYWSNQIGTWYPVHVNGYTGWIWSERLNFESWTFPTIDTYTLENARLWSEADVINGIILSDIAINTPFTIVGGPVVGRIQYDGTTGIWYQVKANQLTGWVWEARLNLN